MSSIEKPIVSNLEDVPDFGDEELNKLFKELDEKTQKEILSYPEKKDQIEILKDINNPELQEELKHWTHLVLPIKKKYETIKKIIQQKKQQKSVDYQKSDKPKIGIIIPFRDIRKDGPRTKQLDKLVSYMDTYLDGENYKIYVIVQQDDKRKFNRGQLLNVGFKIAYEDDVENFIFHDVDLLPSRELKQYYTTKPTDKPVHIAAVWDRYGSNPSYFGGIVAFNAKMFRKINGFPNNFWGWGGEDDELLKRTKKYYDILKPTNGSIEDLEDLNLEEKLQYLRENDLKFMKKREALAAHDETWKTNGLNELTNVDFMILGESTCGENCEKYIIDLFSEKSDSEYQLEQKTPALNVEKDLIVPGFEEDNLEKVEEEETKKITPPEAFNNLVKTFYDLNLFQSKPRISNELEVRFGTKGIKQLTKNDYDNVVKLLMSFGFSTNNPGGTPSLRIRSEFLDNTTGRFKMSDIRTEIDGIISIEAYCRSDDIKTVYQTDGAVVKFTSKRPYIRQDNRKIIRPVDMNDFNFRVSLQTEEQANKGIENYIIENWRKSKKEFRYLNRVSFQHPEFPVIVDLSIVKSGNKTKDKRGFTNIIPVYTINESNVFNNPESYEIEIEVNNKKIGATTEFSSPNALLAALRKVIKYILSGLQGTLYPISYSEQDEIMRSYMKMIWGNEYEPSRKVMSQNFIGPNSITLQITNIAQQDNNSNIPNIRNNFVVTEKADGDRHLMYISNVGKIYLISSNMDIKFTGAKTLNEECFNSLLDGELISHDKKGEFINLYAAFDIYFYKNKDIRNFAFLTITEEDANKNRYYILEKFRYMLNPISITDTSSGKKVGLKTLMDKYIKDEMSPIKFQVKKFYPMSTKQTIFDGCKAILEKEKQGLFEYETDGLIFTHTLFGVGSNVIGKAGPKTKITWEYSFKWKPPQYNTIDFLVTTLKTATGEDVIKSVYEDGLNMSETIQYNEYKIIELRCGFNERTDGYMNPCQDIIDDNLPEYKPRLEEKPTNDYVPKRFYPTEPYNPNAGLCNLMLKSDDSGVMQMFADSGEVITDNTIVEFAYDIDALEGWGWKPLRVRHDKTAKLRRGEREYGNSYKVCNENWKSIHPTGRITEDMLMTGLGIPDINVCEDTYYNTPAGKLHTEAMKNFHNLYVKKMLISGVSKQGDTLIDFACGKAGDLPKWIAAKLSFVFGIDYSKDNLENRIDGACVRYLNSRKNTKNMPAALFVHGNSAYNIRDGGAMLNDRAKQITAAVFGNGPKEADKIGKGVAKQYGKGDTGFNVSSCQFAMHYFFENPDTLRGFLRNVAECTKLNGYFIGTAYDGKVLFNKLKKIKTNESIKIIDQDKQICDIVKYYDADTFEDDSSSIGYKISVCQESINKSIDEYLINFDYFDRVMEIYGFKLISREEANEMGLPSNSGLFSELFIHMLDEIKRNKFKQSLFGEAPNMSQMEKEISFMNRYFIYKKMREVNVEKLYLELGEYEEAIVQRENVETKQAIVVAKEKEIKDKPKIRKLTKKLVLVPATEAVDEIVKPIEKAIEKQEKSKTSKKMKKPPLIIEEDD